MYYYARFACLKTTTAPKGAQGGARTYNTLCNKE